jgi:hypothetical protein
MNKTARRLKRLMGLASEPTLRFKGGIEAIQPGRLTGWVIAPGVALHEVRLLVGNHLIARADINQPRPDVCEAHGWQGQPGFSLDLPGELPPLDWQLRPRLIALSPDGSQQVELRLMGGAEQTTPLLLTLLQSELLGLVGHCDGLQQGRIVGWAGRAGQPRPARIWLQTAGREPQAVTCNQRREGMQALDLPEYCGFSIHPNTLPADWAGREVWFSFDRQNRFRLPQMQAIVLPGASVTEPADLQLNTHAEVLNQQPVHHQTTVLTTEDDLRNHWETVEIFRHYLDNLEQELNARDRARSLPAIGRDRRGWWSRLMRSGD